MRFQEAEERPKMFEELGQRLQHYAKIAADFRDNVSLFVHSEEITWDFNKLMFKLRNLHCEQMFLNEKFVFNIWDQR